MAVRILVADDNELVRGAMCSLLQEQQEWLVCGEATGGADALEKATQLRPDVVLLDISMPDLNGFQVARRIHEQVPTCEILIVSENDSRTFEHIGARPGVRGYVMKSRLSYDLVSAVEAASKHESLPVKEKKLATATLRQKSVAVG